MKKNILIIGSGGREHALGWKLSQSNLVERVWYAPGNGGTENNLNLSIQDLNHLLEFAKKNNCFTVVGPEKPLAEGIVDIFEKEDVPIFGPNREAARLEYSKVFAKNFLAKNNIPTSPFEVFQDVETALSYVGKRDLPIVIKVDGLAEGKGSIICHSFNDAENTIKQILLKHEFGTAGESIIVEDFIKGFEVSFIGICDGKDVIPLETSQDHKQVFDGDRGPNTGGMGAYSPVPMIDDGLFNQILDDVLKKTVIGMRNEGLVIKGVLYAGLIISGGVPYVLEFNCRFGDPETQPQMFRMKSDLLPYIEASSEGNLGSLDPIDWRQGSSVCVVLSSGGYPSSYQIGKNISGLDKVKYMDDVKVFHAGTARNNGGIITNGGRVLGVTALGVDLESAISRAYQAIDMISFEGAHFRKDIGKKGISKKKEDF